MKYEDEYSGCFDWLMFDPPEWDTESLKLLLETWYDMKIANVDEFEKRLFALFEKAHEEGIVRPMTDEERETEHQLAVEQKRAYVMDDGTVVYYGLARYN